MAVPSLITDLSTTAASNPPAGSENPFPDLDNHLRAVYSFIAQNYASIQAKASLSGATFTGAISSYSTVQAKASGSNGAANLKTGNSTNSGYVEFPDPSGVSTGFIGNADATKIQISAYLSRYFEFNIPPQCLADATTSNGLVRKSQMDAAIAARPGRNVLINADFSVNQRAYVSGSATTSANQFTLDRWFVPTSGQSVAMSASGRGNVVTAPASGICQVVEAANVQGGTYVLSWTGTATATVNGSAVTNGGTVSLTANTNAVVKFSGGTVSLAQLERGTTATAFEFRDAATEMALCQRYYESLQAVARFWATGVGQTCNTAVQYKVSKRASPTLTLAGTVTNTWVSSENVYAGVIPTDGCRYEIVSAGTGDAWISGRIVIASAELTS